MKLIILAAFIGVCAAGALQPQYPYQYKNYQFPNNQYPYQYQNNQYPYQYRNYQYQDQRARAAIDKNAQILRSDSEVTPQGYRYAYETDNGIQAEESGVESNGNNAVGSYSYTGDDGQVYSVRYTADANGFQPQGAHLPTPPPVPEAIARSLEANARDEAAGIFDDGSYRGGVAPSVVLARQYYNQNRYYPYNRINQLPNRYY